MDIMDIIDLLLSLVGVILGWKVLNNQKNYIQDSKVNNLCGNAGNVTINQNMNCDADKVYEISEDVADKKIQMAKDDMALKWEDFDVDDDGTLNIPDLFTSK